MHLIQPTDVFIPHLDVFYKHGTDDYIYMQPRTRPFKTRILAVFRFFKGHKNPKRPRIRALGYPFSFLTRLLGHVSGNPVTSLERDIASCSAHAVTLAKGIFGLCSTGSTCDGRSPRRGKTELECVDFSAAFFHVLFFTRDQNGTVCIQTHICLYKRR